MRRPATALILAALTALALAAPSQAAEKKKPAPGKAVPPITITGTVYTFDNQEPIGGATVGIAELPGLQAISGPTGQYSLEIPGGTVFTPYADAARHHRIYLQTFVSEGENLRGVNFQMPTQTAYNLLAAVAEAPRDSSGEIVNCAVVSTFSAQQTRDLSHDAFRAYGAHGVAGAVAAAEPALPRPIYFNEEVFPDRTRRSSSIDGGVLWPVVPTGVYRFTAFHPATTFAPFRATCAPGRVVNANPTRGFYELRAGEVVDNTVDAETPKAKVRGRRLVASLISTEYVSVSAALVVGAAVRSEAATRGYAPGNRKVKLAVPRSMAGRNGVVRIEAEDAEGNIAAFSKRVTLPAR
jgi:hypothetical protein